jgi:hypothetical protein
MGRSTHSRHEVSWHSQLAAVHDLQDTSRSRTLVRLTPMTNKKPRLDRPCALIWTISSLVFAKEARTGCQSFVNHQHAYQTSPVDDDLPTELLLLYSDHPETGQWTIYSLIILDVASLATSMAISGILTCPSTALYVDGSRHTLSRSTIGEIYAMKLYSPIKAGASTIVEKAEGEASRSAI